MAIINKPKKKLMKVATAAAKVKEAKGAGRAKATKPAKKKPAGAKQRTKSSKK